MSRKEELDDLLIAYIDGHLDTTAKVAMEIRIKDDPDVRSRYEWLTNSEKTLQMLGVEEPGGDFTERVMQSLEKQSVFKTQSFRNSLFLLLGIIMTVIVCGILMSNGVFDGNITLNFADLMSSGYNLDFRLPSFLVSGKWVVYTIITLNIALAFLVLDRTILKPWFQNRARMM